MEKSTYYIDNQILPHLSPTEVLPRVGEEQDADAVAHEIYLVDDTAEAEEETEGKWQIELPAHKKTEKQTIDNERTSKEETMERNVQSLEQRDSQGKCRHSEEVELRMLIDGKVVGVVISHVAAQSEK